MPTSIRELRSDIPGELEGICVKMMQKDPRYRYQTAADVAVVLEKFAAKVPKGQRVNIGLGDAPDWDVDDGSSSISLDDGSRPGTTDDTISNKNDETLASSRSKVIRGKGLSASDSGRLVDVRPKHVEYMEGSFLDLEVESGYQKLDSGKEREKSAQTSAPSHQHSSTSSVRIGDEAGRSFRSGFDSRSGHGKKKGLDPALVVALLVALIIVVMVLGVYIGRMTAS